MTSGHFETETETAVPAVTADQMREVDRVAVEEVGLGLLQMMENAGRSLADHARDLGPTDGPVAVLAGGGGNGGGGLCAARHLANRDVPVRAVLDRDADELTGAAETQFGILREMGVAIAEPDGGPMDGSVADTKPADETVADADLVIDAVIGYSLRGRPRGRAKNLIDAAADADAPVLSLDVPSGYDATTGETPGAAVAPTRTMTLALPKTGLDAVPGDLFLADVGIPATVYERLGVEYESSFEDRYWVELTR